MSPVTDFCLNQQNIPASSQEVTCWLLLYTLCVAIASSHMQAGQIAKDYAVDAMAAGNPKKSAPILFDGRIVSLAGAAWALATQIDNLESHMVTSPQKGILVALWRLLCVPSPTSYLT